MSLFEIALVICIIIVVYNLQQMKIILKQKGYQVEMLTGMLRDHQQFKTLIQSETDQKTKIKYQQRLNGLYFALFGVVLFAFMVVKDRMA